VLGSPNGYGQVMRPVHVLWRDARAHGWDYALAAAMVGAAIVALVTRIDVQDFDAFRFHADTWWSWAATIAICGGLVGRRRWPLRSLAFGLVFMLPLELGKHRDSIAFFALVIGLYSVSAHLRLRLAWRGVAMLGALYVVLAMGGTTVIDVAPIAGPTFFATAFALGRMRRRSWARQLRQVDAANERAAAAKETADLAAAAERLRMAQELHDVVAHSLSVIAVQAGIGVHLIDRDPAEAERALHAISTTSATATSELVRLVGILRDGTAPDDTWAPSLNDLPGLLGRISSAGVPVVFARDGDLERVSGGASLAAYRIVQEALTNVVRHAGRAGATVTVRASDDLVDLLIDDDGRGATTNLDPAIRAGGNGLVGMRERAQMYGGEVQAGSRPGGGFRVHATLRPHATSSAVVQTPANPMLGSTAPPGPRTIRWRLPVWQWDLLLAVLMAVVTTLEIFKSNPPTTGPQVTPTDGRAWLLRIGCGLALVTRRRYPALTLATTWLLSMALALGGYQLGGAIFILWIALYSVGSYASTQRLVVGGIGSLVGMVIVAWTKPPDLTATGATWIGFLFAAAAVAGYVARRDRERLRTDLAEREGDAEATARRALLDVTTERLQIADELSTVITRSIDTIATHARTGSQLVGRDPALARNDLEAISMISRDALNDLRRLVKRIRTETEPATYRPMTPALVTSGDVP
jgi:signal transduction histidine kinase